MSSKNKPKDTFSSRLESAIKSRGLSKKELAERIGIAPQSLTKYVNGRLPGGEILIKMALALGCSSDYLLGISQTADPWQARAEQAERKLAVLRDCSQTLAETVQKMTSAF